MNSRANTRTRLGVLPVLIALLLNVLLPISRAGIGLVSAADGIDDYSQCQIGNPSSGLDCESWINGILNATHNNYNEDEVVPQRLVIDFDDTDNHTVTLSYMARKDSGGQNHAYDYLATWNHTYVNADRCQSLGNPALCVGGLPSIFPIPSDPNSVTPGGPQPTSAHELPQANRQFVMYGGTITGTSAITHSTDPEEAGSDYGNITISFDVTDSNGRVMLLFGGHLAAGFGPRGWGAGLGAAGISGGPYHIRVTGIDGASAGNRDNQIMSNAISPVPGLAIAKTTSTPVISAGEVASYTVTVTNSGQGDATGVVITDTLPSGVTWTDTSDSCTITNGFQLSCGPLTIPASSSFSVTVTGTTDAGECPSISNTASYTSTNGGRGDTAANPTLITVNCPTIRVEKTPDEDTQNPGANDVNVGSAAMFTVTVHNDGAGTASGLTVFDDLPGTGWSVVAADTTLAGCAVTDPSTGEHADKGEILTCGPDTIGAGLSKKVTVTRTTTTADCGELNNTASAASSNDGTDEDAGNIDVLCPQIRVEKTPHENEGNPGANDVSAGDAASFTITVFNDGAAPATYVNLFDDLPGTGWSVVAGATLTGCAVTDSSSGEHADKGEILTCGPDTIGVGASKSVTIAKTTAPADCGSIDNTASVTIGNGAGDSDSGNIDMLCPTITVEKTPDDGTVDAPGTATFTILSTNGGLGVAADAELFDDLPEVSGGWTLGSVPIGETAWDSCTIFDTDHPTLGDIGEWLSCGPEDIEAGGDRTAVVTTSVTTEDCGRLPNTAEIEISNGAGDTDSGLITVQCPDLDITKSADDATVNAGDEIGFSITVSNSNAAGTGLADSVTLNDPLPGSLALGVDWRIDAVILNGGDPIEKQQLCSITGSPASETLVCNFGDLNPGDDYEVQLSSDTSAPIGCDNATLPNEATAETDNHAAIKANASIAVQCPDLDIDKTTSTPVINAGGVASYTITIDNDGDGDAVGVDLIDDLPAGLTWSENSAACSISGSQLSCRDLTILAHDSFSVTVTGTTDEDECPSILNRAAFASDNAGSGASAPEGQGTLITVNCPDMQVEKEWVDANGDPTTDPVTAGNTAYFAITVTNNGPRTAIGVNILDFAPDGTIWTVEDDGGFDCPSMIDDAGDSCTAEEMEPGSATILLSYLTGPEDCGSLVNEVEVSAGNEPARLVNEKNEDSATAIVECPGLNIVKLADATPIDAGEEASFHVLIWNSGDGDALNAEFGDDLPPGSWSFDLLNADQDDTCSSGVDADGDQSIACEFETLEPSAMPEAPFGEASPGKVIRVYRDTDRDDCGPLDNFALADASNDDQETDEASIVVKCPTIGLEKENDAVGSVLPGTEVTYTLTLTVTDGPAEDVVVVDELPIGLVNPTDISDGGTPSPDGRTITWELGGDRGNGTYLLTYRATVADDVENGEELINAAAATSTNSQCPPDLEPLPDECDDESTVIPRVPTLVIDKVADVEVIEITGPANTPVATPSVVTWTLTYTLANGPVTNAVITDEVPAGLEYVDGSASNGGVFDEATNTITWTFPTLTESGSVTFQTSVDPETISRIAPTVNVAVIDSDETAPDDGEDSITVTVELPPLGGNPTPTPSLPDTATGFSPTGQPVNVPVELLAFVFIGSMGALALANVRARSRRR